MQFGGVIDVSGDADNWGSNYCLNHLLRNVPEYFGSSDHKFRFRYPRKIIITQSSHEDDVHSLEFVEAPIEIVLNERNQTLDDLLAHDGVFLEKHINAFGYFNPDEDAIILCLGPLRNLATNAVRFFHNLDFNLAYASLIQSTFLHELTHATFNHEGHYRTNSRLSEGIANLVPLTVSSQFDMALQGFKVMKQRLQYNYHYILVKYSNLWNLLDAMVRRQTDTVDHMFLREVLQEAERMQFEKPGASLRIGGNASHLYLGFGAEEVEFFVGGTSDAICNFHGQVVAGILRGIEGYMDPDRTMIISNQIVEKPYYQILKPHTKCIYEVPVDELNIKKELQQGNYNFDDIMRRTLEIATRTRNVISY